jgi:hypothetical protein
MPSGRGFLSFVVALAAAAAVAGCSIEADQTALRTTKIPGRPHITFDSLAVVPACGMAVAPPGIVTATCRYVEAMTGQSITSVINLTGVGFDAMRPIPLGIIQVPADATGFTGTWQSVRGPSGNLVFSPGHAALALDARTTLAAEPGMQLVLVELPAAAAAETHFMVMSWDASTTQFKAMTAGRVRANNQDFFPALVPCTSTMAAVPEVPVPDTSVATRVDVRPIAAAFTGCTGKTYDYAGAGVPVTVVEYYNQALDHYFITWLAAEQANLDAGNTPTRWTRTGRTFKAYATPQAGTSPICRFYIPPLLGDSHFFGRGVAECNATGLAHPTFTLEDPQFMHLFLPTAGLCPPGTVPVYRVFSNRPDANHRYMTSRADRDTMVARGWLAEGDGPDFVVMCAPA